MLDSRNRRGAHPAPHSPAYAAYKAQKDLEAGLEINRPKTNPPYELKYTDGYFEKEICEKLLELLGRISQRRPLSSREGKLIVIAFGRKVTDFEAPAVAAWLSEEVKNL